MSILVYYYLAITEHLSFSIESLKKLHAKATQVDGYLDDRMEPSTVRNVWNEVRDNVGTGM